MPRPSTGVTIAMLWASSAAAAAPTGGGALLAELKPATVAAFDSYVRLAETRIEDEVRNPGTFLYLDTMNEARRRNAEAAMRRGEIVIESLKAPAAGKQVSIPDGRVHHWLGVGFIPGVRLEDAVKLLQDYDRHAEIYKPAVQRSKTLGRDGDRFRVFLRFYQKKVSIAVTVNSEHAAEFFRPAPDRAYSRIRSTRIAEVEDAGTAREREKPVGRDGGYLWRLNTYWRFLERDGGTYIQCESITLTRDIPFGFGWLIGPFVTSIPRESLTFTMERTRDALTRPPGR
jgi:hypothetical protein